MPRMQPKSLLFSLFVSNVESYLENNTSGLCQLQNSHRLWLLKFADDSVLLADIETDHDLLNSINNIENTIIIHF